MNKDLAQRVRALEQKGWTKTLKPGGHLQLRDPLGKALIHTGSTPSDWRALKNLDAHIKRVESSDMPKKTKVTMGLKRPTGATKVRNTSFFKFDRPTEAHIEQTQIIDFCDPLERLVSWAFCILRLRAAGQDWDTIRIFKRRFVTDEMFRDQTINALEAATEDEVASLRRQRNDRHGIKTAVSYAVIMKPAVVPVGGGALPMPTLAVEPVSEPLVSVLAVVVSDVGVQETFEPGWPTEQPDLGADYLITAIALMEGNSTEIKKRFSYD